MEESGRWNSKEKIWSGGIRELYAGRADVSILDIIISNDRFNLVDYTHSLFNYKNILVIQKPKNLLCNMIHIDNERIICFAIILSKYNPFFKSIFSKNTKI